MFTSRITHYTFHITHYTSHIPHYTFHISFKYSYKKSFKFFHNNSRGIFLVLCINLYPMDIQIFILDVNRERSGCHRYRVSQNCPSYLRLQPCSYFYNPRFNRHFRMKHSISNIQVRFYTLPGKKGHIQYDEPEIPLGFKPFYRFPRESFPKDKSHK